MVPEEVVGQRVGVRLGGVDELSQGLEMMFILSRDKRTASIVIAPLRVQEPEVQIGPRTEISQTRFLE